MKIWSYFSAKLLLYIIYIIVIIYYYYYNKICKVRFMSVCFSVRPPHFALTECWGVMSCRIIILSSNPQQIRLGGRGWASSIILLQQQQKTRNESKQLSELTRCTLLKETVKIANSNWNKIETAGKWNLNARWDYVSPNYDRILNSHYIA